MQKKIEIKVPFGKLAADDDAAAKIRASLAKKMREGQPIPLASSGNVTGQTGEQMNKEIQPGKLAADDDAAAKIRASLAKKMREGQPIPLASSGNVTGQTGEQMNKEIQPGKLAAYQWYEREPVRLNAEKHGMKQFFPQFSLHKMDDGRYYWLGSLRPGVVPNGWAWQVAAIYNNDHPKPIMGGSVRVVLIEPSIETVIQSLGWTPSHLIRSTEDGLYLCTTRAEDMSYQTQCETTAAQTLTWAVKWLTALELVMTGNMSKEEFNRHDGI